MTGEQQLKETPLAGEHEALGATFTDFGGWRMPVKYAGDLAEHRAVRERAGLFDLSHMGEVRLTGPEAAAALDRALVGIISAVKPGRAKYSLMCDEEGGIIDDLITYRLAEDELLVVPNAGNAPVVAAELARRAEGLDCVVRDESAETALVAIQGPKAVEILLGETAEGDRATIEGMRYYAAAPVTVAGIALLAARTGYTGEDGFELYVGRDRAAELWRALLAAGESEGLEPAGLAARDSLRLEAAMPLYGHELGRDISPYEAGLGPVVKLDKPEFAGREALAAAAERTPRRVLVGLVGEGRRAARAGYPIFAGEEEIGVVTSGLLSPTLGVPIALAFATPEHAAEGSELEVDIRGRRETYRVAARPFYARAK